MNLQDYWVPQSWYEEDITMHEAHKTRIQEDLEEQIANAREFFTGIQDMLYGRQKFDHIKLERYMDELAAYLDTKLVPGDLKIEEKKS
jgi:hypothetical protein